MKSAHWVTAIGIAACLTGTILAADAPAPQVVQIAANERVVHVIGTPFDHPYYGNQLETLLVGRYACRGLVFRQVVAGSMRGVLSDVDARILIHKPTLVVIQTGNDDLYDQARARTFDFSVYPKRVEDLIKRLRAANVKLILCSVIPLGNGSAKDKLIPPVDGLKGWVDAAREIAARENVVFVDQFTEALGWPMIGSDPKWAMHYGPDMHEKSWRLFLDQVRFEPAGSTAQVDAKTGQAKCNGAAVSDVKADGKSLSFTLQNDAGLGPALLKADGLAPGSHNVIVADKTLAKKSAAELASGMDFSGQLQTQIGTKEYKAELDSGHAAVAALATIQNYRLPGWIKLADFEAQKQAALQRAVDALAQHDAAMKSLVTPKPLAVRIEPVAAP